MATKHGVRGTLCALGGGILWGFSGSCADLVFTNYNVDPLWATAVRMAIAGLLVMAVNIAQAGRGFIAPMRNLKSILLLLTFAVFGLIATQFTYLKAISYSNAPTATVIQYTSPVIVMAAMCVSMRRKPSAREVVALVCVLLGVFFLATHGNPSQLALSPEALVWSLISAVAVSLYTLLPVPLMNRYGSMPTLAWGLVLGAVIINAIARPWAQAVAMDAVGWLALVGGLCVLGTAVAFLLYFQGVKDVGATHASMLASVEVVSSTVCSVVWLGISFTAMDFLGLAFIGSTVFLLAKRPGQAEGGQPVDG